LTQEDVRTATKVIIGMIELNSHSVYALFDPGAIHSFVASRNVNKLRGVLEKGIIVSTTLISLEIIDFDIILEMDWLSAHRAQINCYIKVVTFLADGGNEVTFMEEKRVIPNYVILAMTASKCLRKWCQALFRFF
jgi:hypothetical protein